MTVHKIETRIKLAEAMGWKSDDTKTVCDQGDGYPSQRTSFHWSHPDHERKRFAHELPDPFTDANDDYAVLEWARNEWLDIMGPAPQWVKFRRALLRCRSQGEAVDTAWTSYRIGDYARAALKVIE